MKVDPKKTPSRERRGRLAGVVKKAVFSTIPIVSRKTLKNEDPPKHQQKRNNFKRKQRNVKVKHNLQHNETFSKWQRTSNSCDDSLFEKGCKKSLRYATYANMPPSQRSAKKILHRIRRSSLNRSALKYQLNSTKNYREETEDFVFEDSVIYYANLPTPNRDCKQKESVPIFNQGNMREERTIESFYKQIEPFPLVDRSKRPIVIDGSNVAFGHSRGQFFSVQGIKIAIDYFEAIGHSVRCVVPSFRIRPTKSSDPELLHYLHQCGKVLFTPCKRLQTYRTSSYDDRFTLKIASEFDAAVVSNDHFYDLINESEEFRTVIETRVITFMFCEDLFILSKDPYGRQGPNLEQILKR